MKKILLLALLAVFCALAGACSTYEYRNFEGGSVRCGSGGSRKTVQGIDLWADGTPNRSYRVIGILEGDVRDTDVAKACKERGGDAAVLVSEKERHVQSFQPTYIGGYGHCSPLVLGSTYDFYYTLKKYQIIRYSDRRR